MQEQIKFFNPYTNEVESEKVYGEKAIKWLYASKLGSVLKKFIRLPFISMIYGETQSTSMSSKKIKSFIKKYNINMNEYESPENFKFESFNHFFIRKFKDSARTFIDNKSSLPAFCEGRYVGFNNHDSNSKFPVKGDFLKREDILKKQKYNEIFKDGPLYIARLCPVDYHRFHFPDDGEVVDNYIVNGGLDSVNPLALLSDPEILISNHREVTVIKTENFGLLAMIEVGATCVGKIIQSYKDKNFKRGDEKGYFLFGGSTVIVIGQKGKWQISETIDTKTKDGMEVFIKLGDEIGRSV